jgi:hypothetical protein
LVDSHLPQLLQFFQAEKLAFPRPQGTTDNQVRQFSKATGLSWSTEILTVQMVIKWQLQA